MPCNNTCLMGDICGDRYGGSQKPPCASKPVELSTTAPNTGSPKLLDALERFSKRMEDAYAAEDTKYVHACAAQDFYAVVKQLRAGA